MGNRVVGDQDERIAAWVAERLPGFEFGDYPYTAIGLVNEVGIIKGGVILNTYTGRDIHLHVAGLHRRWLTRDFLGEVFRHVFLQLGCRRCTVIIAASNERSLLFCAGIGWQQEGVLRARGEQDEDWIIMGMLREECRFLKTRSPRSGTTSSRPSTLKLRTEQRRGIAAHHAPLRQPAGQ